MGSSAIAIFPSRGGGAASLVTYDDTAIPPIGATSVQDALDFFKTASAGGWPSLDLHTATVVEGNACCVSATDTAGKTDAAAEATSRCVGAFVGVAGKVQALGPVNFRFSTASGVPVPGGVVFLARADDEALGAAAGKLTSIAPTTGFVAEVGIVMSVDVNFAVTRRAVVTLQIKSILRRAT